MAGKLWRNVWDILNTEIKLSPSETVKGGTEAAKTVSDLAKALNENKSASELKPLLENLDSLLEVLNSPLMQVVSSALPFVPIATGILNYLAKQTQREPSLADSVQLVAQVAYLESLRQFLQQHPELALRETPASEPVIRQIRRLGEIVEFEGQPIQFEDQLAQKTLNCFHNSPLAKVFNSILFVRFQESGLADDVAQRVTERISRQTHRYMKEAVAQVKDSAPKLAAIYGEGWLQDLETYQSIDHYLQEAIAKKPNRTVFNSQLTFRQIYVPMEVKSVNSDGEIDQNAEPQDIEAWAKTILFDERKHGQVIFIQGGPGRGKSTFCRMFADWVRQELHPIYTPILVRLRDIRAFDASFEKTLENVIGWDFVKSDRGWLTDCNTRFLFLLDGFDELILERGASNDLKQFLEQAALFQQRCAEIPERQHRVLMTGRPMALYGIERLMPPNLERAEITLMSDKVQERWFEKWELITNSRL
ncbi:MAG: NACHT domain-containing protein [Microcoleaceae cyanobacterium]